jgi:hypothetical protein
MFNFLFKKKDPEFIPKRYVLFNVDTFNTWFNDKDNDAVYANSGIFLRLDKLSESHIKDYLIKCHGISLGEWDFGNDITNFYYEVRKDWLDKINNKDGKNS